MAYLTTRSAGQAIAYSIKGRMVDWTGCGRKQIWHISKYHSEIRSAKQRNIIPDNPVRIICIVSEAGTGHTPEYSSETLPPEVTCLFSSKRS